MLRNAIDAVVKAYFTALLFLMYFFINEAIYIGGIGITLRHLFALAVIASAFIYFIVRPDAAAAAVSVKSALVFAVPLLVVIASSLLVWVIDKSEISTIARGLSGCLVYTNWLSCALAAASVLYVFGENGIWFNLAALLGSNLVMIFNIMHSDGIGKFIREFFALLTSFAADTGETIVKAEIHELAFCLGAYIIYMLCKPRKKTWFWVLFSLALFCFLAAFKRIAIIAMLVVAALRALMILPRKISEKALRKSVNAVMLICVFLLIAYIAVIKADVFSLLERAGVDTSGRAYVYSHVNEYYKFSPLFVGNGIGFLTYQLNEVVSLGVSAVHNDFLQFFIDLGFFGYILWLLSMTVLRTKYFGRDGDSGTALITMLLTVYLLIVSATDNTINYPLLTTVMGVIIMGNNYAERVRRQGEQFEVRPFGS